MARKTVNLLKVSDVARMLNIHQNTVRHWANTGKLKVFARIGPRRDRRFLKSDVEELLRD